MRCAGRGRCRRGVVTLELIPVIGVILMLVIASTVLGTLAVLKGTVTQAATVAAREAGKLVDGDPLCTATQLAPVVQTILGVNCVTVGNAAGSGTRITLEVASPPLTSTYGDPDLDCLPPTPPTLSPDEVRVTICVALDATPFCNRLSFFGVVLGNTTLQASAVVKREKFP